MRNDQLHQKLGLVQQLKTLARQHEQILQAYERKVQEKLQEGSLAGTAGGKRAGPPLVAEGPEAKRHRQLAERASRKNELWTEVIKIVEKIRKNAKSEHFRAPVDPIKLRIPDYPNVITKPMDLGTVLKKLRSKPPVYTQPQEVAEDVRQIWINCRTYNGATHVVTQAANTCSEAFEKAWGQANIEQRWEVEMMREQREEQAFAGGEAEAGDDTLVNQLRYKRNMLGDLIAAKDVQDNLPPGSLGDLALDRAMTFEEKRKLSAHMASLPGEKLVQVLDIISESEENLQADGDGEIEVDIDALQNNTLWKLKAYVDGVLTATSGPPPKKSANRSAPNKQGPPAAAAAGAMAGAGGMPPPPPPAVAGGHPGALQPPQQQPLQQQPPAAGAMPPPPQQPPQAQQPQPMQPPPQQQPQQQGQQSPQHSGGVSAQEVVGSTAGGPNATRSHQFTYDMGTVAQSGTNARPSNFVKSTARQSTPTADAAGGAAAGEQPAQAGPTHMDAGTAQQWEASLLKGGPSEAAPAAAAAGAAEPAVAAAPGAAAAAADAPAAAAAEPMAVDAAPAPAPAGAPADAPAAPAEAPAAPEEATAAAPPAAAEDPAAAAPAAAEEPAAAAPAAGDGSDDDLDEWAKAAARQEAEEAQRKEEERRRQEEAEAQKRLKAEQEVQKQKQEQEARANDIYAGMGGAGGAAANDDAVHADVEKLLTAAPAPAARGASSTPPPGAAPAAAAGDGDAMDVDSEGEKQQQDEDDDGEPADGGGFD